MLRASASTALLIAGLAFAPPARAAESEFSVRLEMLWSTPIIGATMPTQLGPVHNVSQGSGVVLSSTYATAAADPSFLADVVSPAAARPALLTVGTASAQPVTLSFKDDAPASRRFSFVPFARPPRAPFVLAAAAGTNGATWVGGFANAYTGIDSNGHLSAFVAKVDPSGRSIQERLYGPGEVRQILPQHDGGALILRFDGPARSWVSEVDPSGRLRSTTRLPGGAGLAMATAGADLVVAGMTGSHLGAGYHEDVVFWTLAPGGAPSGAHLLRPGLNTRAGENYGFVAAFPADDGAYVASAGSGAAGKPVQIALVSSDGRIVWSRTLADTISLRPYTSAVCTPTLLQLDHRSSLAACALDGAIHVYRFNQATGDYIERRLPLPACQAKGGAALFLTRSSNGEVRLSGSRASGNIGPSCSWTGRLTGVDLKAEGATAGALTELQAVSLSFNS